MVHNCSCCQECVAELARLRRENTELQQKSDFHLRKWKEETARANGLHSRLMFEEEIDALPSSKMTANQKYITKAIDRLTAIKAAQPGQQVQIYRQEIARMTGISEQTVSSGIAALKKRGVVDHRVVRSWNRESGQGDAAMFAALTPQFKGNPSGFEFKDEQGNELNNNWGGQRYACKTCGSLDTIFRDVVEVICKSCGEVHLLDTKRKEDRPFIIDEETAAHWQERYQTPIEELHVEIQGARARVNERIQQIEAAASAPAPEPDREPIPMLRRPRGCNSPAHRDYWIETTAGPRCKRCEPAWAV